MFKISRIEKLNVLEFKFLIMYSFFLKLIVGLIKGEKKYFRVLDFEVGVRGN